MSAGWDAAPALVPRKHGPGAPWAAVRSYYEEPPFGGLDEGRTNGGESLRDQGERMLPVRPRKLRPRGGRSRRGEAPKGAPAGVIGRRLRRSGDRPDREAGHGCGVPHQRFSALHPLDGGPGYGRTPRRENNRGGGALAFARAPRCVAKAWRGGYIESSAQSVFRTLAGAELPDASKAYAREGLRRHPRHVCV
jgi:hypothetical protein